MIAKKGRSSASGSGDVFEFVGVLCMFDGGYNTG